MQISKILRVRGAPPDPIRGRPLKCSSSRNFGGAAASQNELRTLQMKRCSITLPTQPSTLKREENEYVPSGAESIINCLDTCEVPCYGHARWHSGALLGSSRPGSAWLPDKGNSSYKLAYPFRFFQIF